MIPHWTWHNFHVVLSANSVYISLEHLDKLKAVSKQNSESISSIKSTLTDRSKAVNGLLKVIASDGSYTQD